MLLVSMFLPLLLSILVAVQGSDPVDGRIRRSPLSNSYLPPAPPARPTSPTPPAPPAPSVRPAPDTTPCLQLPVVQNFEKEKYLGRWYEIQRFVNPFQSGSCVTADYSLLPNGSVGVTNSQIFPNGTFNGIVGSARLGADPSRGSLTVSFPGEAPPMEGNYNVIATDYTNYAVVYSCSLVNIRGQQIKFEFSWVLSRTPVLDPSFLMSLNQWLAGLGVDSTKYQPTRQTGCQYAPVPNTSY